MKKLEFYDLVFSSTLYFLIIYFKCLFIIDWTLIVQVSFPFILVFSFQKLELNSRLYLLSNGFDHSLKFDLEIDTIFSLPLNLMAPNLLIQNRRLLCNYSLLDTDYGPFFVS